MCSVIDCPTIFESSTKFYTLPSCTANMPVNYQHITKKQEIAWLHTIPFKSDNLNKKICSRHFYSGN